MCEPTHESHKHEKCPEMRFPFVKFTNVLSFSTHSKGVLSFFLFKEFEIYLAFHVHMSNGYIQNSNPLHPIVTIQSNK